MSLATFGLYGEFKSMAKGIQTAFKCAKEMANLVKQLTKYTRIIKVSDPQTSQDKLLTMLYQTDNVVFDLPVTICTCLGIKVAEKVKFADKVTNTAELVLKEVISNANSIVSSWSSFTSFMEKVALGEPISSLNETDITSLKSAMESNTTCGFDMKRVADRTWMTVAALRQQNPEMSENDLRVAMSKSDLVLSEIPIVTNNCMTELIDESGEATAYTTRGTLRKTFSGIVEDLITSGTSSNGTFLAAEEYAYKVADKVASFYGVWDVTGITNVLAEYFQTICGPTKFIGDIDDGTAEDALGLTMAGDAFNGSSGSWTKEGDGTVSITFESSDTDDVTVNIQSGGSKLDEVDVATGETVTWSSNVTALGGKTLYLDRWRPGILGLPGTGGGSLLMWVPRATESGGNLKLAVKLNVS
uniref:Jacalin-type lectin domain-containing protein n=1 Tax=Phytophthora ramorum TaxID=164328 RepID=H3GEF4_PHYRM